MKRFLLATALLAASAAQAAPDIRVARTCAGAPRCFATLGEALAQAGRDPDRGWTTIRIAPGTYREKVTVARARTRLVGDGAASTRLVYDAVAQTAGRYHRAGWGTPGSATLTIDAADVVVSGLTIENDYDYLANDRLPDGDPAKIANPQAAALLADIDSDRVSIRGSAILGYQDTFFANGKRVHVANSLIAGNIDFIFGNGAVLIEGSEIRSRVRGADTPGTPFQSFVAAPSTLRGQPVGIVFYRSRLTREAGVPDGAVALARPWHPTTQFSDGRYADPDAVGQASFLDCWMDAHIASDHWTSMNGTARDGTKTAVFRAQDSRFWEQGSTGPGARRREIGMPTSGLGDIGGVRAFIFKDWRQPSAR